MTMARLCLLLISALPSTTTGFTLPSTPSPLTPPHPKTLDQPIPIDPPNPIESIKSIRPLPFLTASLPLLLPLTAHAAGPDWGIFEGRTGSLLHPLAMISLAALSGSTALLGFQWRRQRTIGDEISSLKKTLPEAVEGEALGGSSVEKEIEALTLERKNLATLGPRDKHFSQGSLLLVLGIAFAIEGPLNTYARAGKLFPGPHLYAGAGLVVLWALAASMVPPMQKGNDVARNVHIGANLAGIGLFLWQITSGIPILLKVIEFTKWP